MSKYWAVENQSWVMPRPGERFHRMTSRSGSSYGRGRNSRAFATLKMEVFAPMPIASDNTAASVNQGLLANERRANRMSCIQVFIGWSCKHATPTSDVRGAVWFLDEHGQAGFIQLGNLSAARSLGTRMMC